MTKNLDNQGLQSIADNYDLFYIDLWGVVHNGIKLHDKAITVLKKLKKMKKNFILLTNAPRPNETVKKFIPDQSNISKYIDDLKNINLRLWDIEDGKRAAEKNKDFGDNFIELARNVYKFNDERAKIKLEINNTLGSRIKEVKSYD